MAAAQYYEQIQQAYIAYYGRPADPAGQAYWATQMDKAGGNINVIINAFGNSAESTALYGGSSTAAQVNAVYHTLFGRDADVAGLNFYVNGIINGTFSLASVALNIYNGATGTDATELAAKLTYADAFTTQVSQTTAAQVAYAGNAAAVNARAAVAAVTDSASATAAAVNLSTTVANIGTGSVSQTVTLTTGVDNLVGAAGGNNVFIADNTATGASGNIIVTSAADAINGGSGGNNTLKLFAHSGDSVGLVGSGATEVLPQLTNVQNLWISGATEGATVLDVSGITGLQKVTIDSPVIATGVTNTVKVAGQSVTFSNVSTTGANTATEQVTSAADTAANVTLSKVAPGAAATGSITLDIAGTKTTTLNLTSTGGANKIALSDSGTALTTLNLAGDQKLTLTEGLSGLKTINASGDTGGVSVSVSTTVAPSFAFTGGSGNDTLTITTASLEALSAGSQLNGGVGTDTLVISDAGTLTAADYTALNATTGFEVLGVGGVAAASVDASKITGAFANHFAVSDTGGVTISNLSDASTVDLTAAGTDTFGAAVGASSLNLNLNTSATAKGVAFGIETVTGFSTVNLSSNGDASQVNSVTFVNSDNTKFVVSGSNDLTMSVGAATATGDKVDASAFTGALTLTDSGKGDVILTGSGTTTINETSTSNADTITLLAGHTKVDTIVLSAQYTATDVVNNFALGQDVIKGAAALSNGTELSAVKGVVASAAYNAAADFITAAKALTQGVGDASKVVEWYDAAHNNTYVAQFTGTTGNVHVVELVGVHATAIDGTAAAGHIVLG
ncbi:DUF4214 domain-containing protein [Paraburkholderia sp. CNPSo 3157]|uniref:DUF4214 domain-containing protein n=1 Tax=Paraburkholderia franconis TaxID=2654983 RepID=A0A7X1TFY4_9BURK|nr:DUF4214 domain-containing protein [Paraburkholderia franconis]MPW17862.1 DUF4214 domain-containing protein [Paraburkholderia franconis]